MNFKDRNKMNVKYKLLKNDVVIKEIWIFFIYLVECIICCKFKVW